MFNFFVNVLEQGTLYAILAMGVMLSYNIIGVSDLSVDGTFPLGAVVSAVIILNGGNPWVALLASLIAGVIAGSITGLLHVKLKITSLLSGILVMTGLYSINLMIAGGKSNLPLLREKTLFDTAFLAGLNLPKEVLNLYKLAVLLVLVFACKFLVDWILSTKVGYLLKVTGDNEALVTSLGQDVGKVKIIGLALSNGLIAVSGGVAASVGRYYDVSLGAGMIVMGLSSVMLGTLLLRRTRFKLTTMVITGSVVYRFIVALAIRLGMDPQHLKLVTVIIFVIAIVLNNSGDKLDRLFKKGDKNVSI
jgi:putative tryptophan/tyrosine transport system permease protein